MLQFQFTPFPVLETERLLLQRITPADAEALYELRKDPVLMRHIARPLATCVQDVHQLIQLINDNIDKNESINWGIFLKEGSPVLGTIGYVRTKKEDYRAEVGYMIASAQQNKGLVSEALHAIIKYGFETMKLHSIEAMLAPENIASARVLEKAGFVQEGLFRENLFFDGKFLDTAIYSLIRPAAEPTI